MNGFYEEVKDIYRLRIPFHSVYTSVFLIRSPLGPFLVDCASEEDVDTYILPALSELGYGLSEVRGLILTHRHSDHAGGLTRLLSLAPALELIEDVRALSDCLCTYPMAGHTAGCIGVLDLRTHTLIAGDGLQGEGVGVYRRSVKLEEAYLETIERIEKDPRIEYLLFSHAYEPWNSDRAMGRGAVAHCLAACRHAALNRPE